MTKKSNPQQTLFELPTPQERYQKRGWFYITRRVGQEMLVGIDPNGGGVWMEHDLYKHMPHIINSLATAKIVMNAVKGTEIRKCWYTKVGGVNVV